MRIQKKSVPFTDNLWVAGVDLKSCGFSALLVRLREDGRRSSSRVPWQQSVPMAPLRAPLCSQPGGTHPPRQDEREVLRARSLWQFSFVLRLRLRIVSQLWHSHVCLFWVVLVFLLLGPERILSIWVSSHSQRYRPIIPRC